MRNGLAKRLSIWTPWMGTLDARLQREMERRQAAAQRAKELDALRAREEAARKRLNQLNK